MFGNGDRQRLEAGEPVTVAMLVRLYDWCADQTGLRLVWGPPLDDRRIDALPYDLAKHPRELSVPFLPADFSIPTGYRRFLRTCSFARIEYRDHDGDWEIYEPFNILSPGEVAKGRSFTDSGTTVNDREIQTTFLVAFATAGYSVEASRWCFYTDNDLAGQNGELPVLVESNDYECDLARYVDTGEPVNEAAHAPLALSFGYWLDTLITVLTDRPFDPERTDAVPNTFYSTE